MLAVGSQKQKINWMPCRVSVDGVIVFKVLFRVEKGTTGNGGKFSCHIIEDSIDWSTLLKDRQICDIPFGDAVPKEKSWKNIYDSWFS